MQKWENARYVCMCESIDLHMIISTKCLTRSAWKCLLKLIKDLWGILVGFEKKKKKAGARSEMAHTDSTWVINKHKHIYANKHLAGFKEDGIKTKLLTDQRVRLMEKPFS